MVGQAVELAVQPAAETPDESSGMGLRMMMLPWASTATLPQSSSSTVKLIASAAGGSSSG
jgi:hypothetical protein